MKAKQLLFSALMLAITSESDAQHCLPVRRSVQGHIHPGIPVFAGSDAAPKTATIKKRLSATASYMLDMAGNITISDSSALQYSGYRGSRLDYNMMTYLPAIGYDHSRSALTSWDSTHAVGTVDYDTLSAWKYDTSTHALKPTRGERRIWNADGTFNTSTATFFAPNGSVVDAPRYVYSWSNGRVTGHTGLRWIGSSYDTSERRFISYDTNNRPAADSYAVKNSGGVWEPAYRTRNMFNTAGKVIVRYEEEYTGTLTGWVPYGADTLEYYPDGSLKSAEYSFQMISGMPLRALYIDSFGYQPGVPGIMHYTSYNLDSVGNRSIYQIVQFGVNGAGQKDTQTITVNFGGMPMPFLGVQLRYNSDGLLTHSTAYSLMGQSPSFFGDALFYYETYNDPAGIAAPDIKAKPQLLPNPANEFVLLSYPEAKTGAGIQIQILNTVGQTVHSEHIVWHGDTEKISIGHLPPGMYQVVVSEGNKSLCTTSMLKQ